MEKDIKPIRILRSALALLLVVIPLSYVINNTSAEVVIYDNISVSQYKTLQVSSDVCSILRVACNHKWYVNGLFMGTFPDGEFVEVPDNSEINVVLEDPINTNLQNLPDSKTNFIIVVMAFLQPVLPWVILFLFIYLIWKRETRNNKRKRR